MNSFLKGFLSVFDLFPSSTTHDEKSEELNNKMQDLYDRMGWGKYNFPIGAYNSAVDINRVLEAEQSFMDEIYRNNSGLYQITERYYKPKQIRDPARPRKNKYL